MPKGYLRNPELGRYLVAQLLVSLSVALVSVLGFRLTLGALDRDIAARTVAAATWVARDYPEAGEALARSLARAYGSRRAPEPPAVAADAPISAASLLALQPGVRALTGSLLAIGLPAVALLLISSLVLPLRLLRSLYDRLRDIASASDAVGVVEGAVLEETDARGDLGLVAQRFNRMAGRVSAVTERMRRERAGLEELVSDISHQLKTPLSSIKLMVELVREGAAQGVQAGVFLERTLRQVDRMDWLIRNLLALARVESGALRYRMADAHLGDTVRGAADSLGDLADYRGVTLRVEGVGGKAPHDARWLAEAVGNVLKNCVEHTPPGGAVTVRMSDTPALARIVVADQGPGVPEDEIPRLFTRFYRGANEPESGTGIGLALAKAVVEAHGGSIRVANAPTGGTTFTFLLPRILTEP